MKSPPGEGVLALDEITFIFHSPAHAGFSFMVLVCLIVFLVKVKGKKCDVICIISFPKLRTLMFISGVRLLSAEGRWP